MDSTAARYLRAHTSLTAELAIPSSCSKAANACDAAAGCISGCKAIPSAAACSQYVSLPTSVFSSALFPSLSNTGSVALQVAAYRSSTAGVCGQNLTYALKPCDLVDLMGGPSNCPNCLYYFDNLREAAEMYDMPALDCNANGVGATRLGAFVAQIRHETASLGVLFQPADNGAGALHMIPAHFAAAISSIPRLKDAFTNEPAFNSVNQMLTADLEAALASNTTLQRQIGLLIQRPEHAFLTAGWWFVQGAGARISPSCGDLRIATDQGMGSQSGPSGYYKVSQCIFGSLNDAGLSDRVAAYHSAMGYANQFSPTYVRSLAKLSNGEIVAIIAAVIIAVCALVWAICRHRSRTRVGEMQASDVPDRKGRPVSNVALSQQNLRRKAQEDEETAPRGRLATNSSDFDLRDSENRQANRSRDRSASPHTSS